MKNKPPGFERRGGDFGEPFDKLRALSLSKGSAEPFIPSRTQPGINHAAGKSMNPRFPSSGGGKPLPYEKTSGP